MPKEEISPFKMPETAIDRNKVIKFYFGDLKKLYTEVYKVFDEYEKKGATDKIGSQEFIQNVLSRFPQTRSLRPDELGLISGLIRSGIFKKRERQDLKRAVIKAIPGAKKWEEKERKRAGLGDEEEEES